MWHLRGWDVLARGQRWVSQVCCGPIFECGRGLGLFELWCWLLRDGHGDDRECQLCELWARVVLERRGLVELRPVWGRQLLCEHGGYGVSGVRRGQHQRGHVRQVCGGPVQRGRRGVRELLGGLVWLGRGAHGVPDVWCGPVLECLVQLGLCELCCWSLLWCGKLGLC